MPDESYYLINRMATPVALLDPFTLLPFKSLKHFNRAFN